MKQQITFNRNLKLGIFISIVFVFSIMLIIFPNKVSADSSYKGSCLTTDGVLEGKYNYYYKTNISETECRNYCKENEKTCYWTKNELSWGDKNWSMPSDAKKIGDFDCKFLETPVVCLLQPVLWFVKILFLAAGAFFGWVIKSDNLSFILDGGGVVRDMWVFVKDLLNISFILVLLFSAFATIFQVEKYNYKKILLTLIIMALLVNFSYPISRIIIDFSNIAMYSLVNTFLSADQQATVFVTSIAANSGLDTLFTITTYKNAGMLLTSVIFLFMLTITLFAFAILLYIRLIALAILIIFSPIGFIGNMIPGLKGAASSWWNQLLKNAFAGPMLILGLVISIRIMVATSKLGDFDSMSTAMSSKTDPNLIGTLAFMIIPIILLWIVMGVAQKSSIAGAGAVMGRAQKMAKGIPWGLTKIGAKKVDRELAKKTGVSLNYKNWQEAWKQKQAEEDTRAYAPAVGKARDLFNRYATPGSIFKPIKKTSKGWRLNIGQGEKTHYQDFAKQANILKKQKEIAEFSEESGYLSRQLENAVAAKDSDKAAAIFRILYNNNDQNEMIKFYNGNRGDVTPEEKKQFVLETLKNSGMKNDDIYKQLSDLGEISFSKGNFSDYGMGIFDEETGKYKVSTQEEQIENAVGKATNVEPQQKMRTMHWNSILTELGAKDKDGNRVGGLHEAGKAMLESFTMSEVNQTNRARKDFINNMHKEIGSIREYGKSVGGEKGNVILAFTDKIEELYSGKSKEK